MDAWQALLIEWQENDGLPCYHSTEKYSTGVLGNTDLRQVYGVQHSHLLVCDALGLDYTWYEAADSI